MSETLDETVLDRDGGGDDKEEISLLLRFRSPTNALRNLRTCVRALVFEFTSQSSVHSNVDFQVILVCIRTLIFK